MATKSTATGKIQVSEKSFIVKETHLHLKEGSKKKTKERNTKGKIQVSKKSLIVKETHFIEKDSTVCVQTSNWRP